MEINRPVTNPRMKEIMQKCKAKRATVSSLIDILFESNLLCPMEMTINYKKGLKSLGFDTTMRVIGLKNGEGGSFLMAFTDWDEFRKWNKEPNQQALVLTFREYRFLLQNKYVNGLVINPYGANILLSKKIL